MAEALRIALLGAECTGKSELTHALRRTLAARTTARTAAVGEWLRHWCEMHRRTPLQGEQAGIAHEQQRRIDAACIDHDIVVCDTTPLMTAVYSIWYFGDDSLLKDALESHRRIDCILLTDPDLPWQADGLQRDGETVREAIDNLLRATLLRHGLAFRVIRGMGEQRVESAWQSVRSLISQAAESSGTVSAEGGTGQHSVVKGASRAESQTRRRGSWVCDCCLPAAESARLDLPPTPSGI